MKLSAWLLIFLAASTPFFPPLATAAVKSVSVQGLLGRKAVLLVDGKRHVVNTGDSTPEGVKLIAIHGDTVVMEIDGEKRQQAMGDNTSFSTRYAEPQSREVLVTQNSNGLFTTVGSINGFTVNLIVDTGANILTLNAQHARRLGVDFETQGVPTVVATASGVVKAYRVTLRTVAVGEIELHNVEAVVMSGAHPEEILLGMTFLGSLEIQRVGNVMKIRKNY
jgi:aspartyl protease family protein